MFRVVSMVTVLFVWIVNQLFKIVRRVPIAYNARVRIGSRWFCSRICHGINVDVGNSAYDAARRTFRRITNVGHIWFIGRTIVDWCYISAQFCSRRSGLPNWAFPFKPVPPVLLCSPRLSSTWLIIVGVFIIGTLDVVGCVTKRGASFDSYECCCAEDTDADYCGNAERSWR